MSKPNPDRKIRILYIIQSLWLAGAENHLVQVLRHLDRERFEPMLACLSEFGPLEAEVRKLGVPLHLFGLRDSAAGLLSGIPAGARFVRSVKPDIVQTYLYKSNLTGAIMGKLGGAALLITSRRGLGHTTDGRPYLRWAQNLVNSFTDAVTVNSLGVKQDVVSREMFVREKLRLIYNGVEWERFASPSRPAADVRAELGLPDGAKVVGCVGNLRPVKGHPDLLEAVALATRQIPDLYLVLVGYDLSGMQAGLERQAQELGIGNRVRFTGERLDVPDLLHAFDLQAQASHAEGFSNAILEGMAAGLPLVATDVGGNAEAVEHGHTGLIVEPRSPQALAEALVAVLSDTGLARAMGAAGQQRVRERFSVQAMVRNLEELYLELAVGIHSR